MADLYDAVSRVVQGMLAKKGGGLYQPGKVLAVHEDGTYSVSASGAPGVVSVPQGDFPLSAGDPVWVSPTWVSPVWHPLTYDPKTGTSVAGFLTPGRLEGGTSRPVIHGKRAD